jgi:hypothetical protein
MQAMASALCESAMGSFLAMTEHGRMPDFVLRAAIRYLLSVRAAAAVREGIEREGRKR